MTMMIITTTVPKASAGNPHLHTIDIFNRHHGTGQTKTPY